MDIETYTPEKKRIVDKGEALPFVFDVGTQFASIGGMIGFFISSFLASFKTFRRTRKRVREFSSRYEKTLDLS